MVAEYTCIQGPDSISGRLLYRSRSGVGASGGFAFRSSVRVEGSLYRRWSLLRNLCLLETCNHLVELMLCVRVHTLISIRSRFSERKGRANDRGCFVIGLLGRVGFVLLVLLAQQVISVGVFAVVRLAAWLAGTFKQSLVSFGGCLSTRLENLFAEDFSGDGRQRGNSSLQVVSAKISS